MEKLQRTAQDLLDGLRKAQTMPDIDCSPLEQSPCYDGCEGFAGFNGITVTMLKHLEPLYTIQGWWIITKRKTIFLGIMNPTWVRRWKRLWTI